MYIDDQSRPHGLPAEEMKYWRFNKMWTLAEPETPPVQISIIHNFLYPIYNIMCRYFPTISVSKISIAFLRIVTAVNNVLDL